MKLSEMIKLRIEFLEEENENELIFENNKWISEVIELEKENEQLKQQIELYKKDLDYYKIGIEEKNKQIKEMKNCLNCRRGNTLKWYEDCEEVYGECEWELAE